MTYNLCVRLISAGKTGGLADKLDVFFTAGRLTDAQYLDLIGRLPGTNKTESEDDENGIAR